MLRVLPWNFSKKFKWRKIYCNQVVLTLGLLCMISQSTHSETCVTSAGEMENVRALSQLLSSPYPEVRVKAAWQLGSIGAGAASAVAPLVALLGDPEIAVRQQAAASLGLIGPAAAYEAVPALAELLSAPDDRTVAIVELALFRLGSASSPVVPALTSIIQSWRPINDSSDPTVLTNAAKALGAIGPAASPAVPTLVRLLHNSDYIIPRKAAAEALGAIGDPNAIIPLKQALTDRDESVRSAARYALSRFPSR